MERRVVFCDIRNISFKIWWVEVKKFKCGRNREFCEELIEICGKYIVYRFFEVNKIRCSLMWFLWVSFS